MTDIKELYKFLNQHSINEVVYNSKENYVAFKVDSYYSSCVGEIRLYPLGSNNYKLSLVAIQDDTFFVVGLTDGIPNGFKRLVRQESINIKILKDEQMIMLCNAIDDDIDEEVGNAHTIVEDVEITLSQFGEGNLGAFVAKYQI